MCSPASATLHFLKTSVQMSINVLIRLAEHRKNTIITDDQNASFSIILCLKVSSPSCTYMSPKIPAKVFFRLVMVSSWSPSKSRAIASTVPGDAGPCRGGGRGARLLEQMFRTDISREALELQKSLLKMGIKMFYSLHT